MSNDLEANGYTPEEMACTLVTLAREHSVQIILLEPFAHMKVATGVCIGVIQMRILFTAALIQAAMFCAAYVYAARYNANVDRIVLRGLLHSIGAEGERQFNGGFISIWNCLVEEVGGQDTYRRIIYDLHGDPSRLEERFLRACAEWALRQCEGTGYLPSFAKDETECYHEIICRFEKFVGMAVPKIRLEDCHVTGGFSRINLAALPPCSDRYDVFISYRRSDGDIIARLVYQELMHRGMRCFIDVESVSHGEYSLQILSALRDSTNFIFIKTDNSISGLDDPNDHVRIELEAAKHFRKNVVVVAPPRVSRDMSNLMLSNEISYLKGLRSFRLAVGEAYEFCIEKILKEGLRIHNS